MFALRRCQSNKERSSNQTKAGTSPIDIYINESVIDTMSVDLLLTFEDEGLATTSTWQPPISTRIFIAIDRIEHIGPGQCNVIILRRISEYVSNLDTNRMSPWLWRRFAIEQGSKS